MDINVQTSQKILNHMICSVFETKQMREKLRDRNGKKDRVEDVQLGEKTG